MSGSVEQILIVYASVDENGEGTQENDIQVVSGIINSFGRSGGPPDAVRTRAFVYRISEAVAAGETVSSQILDAMRDSLGAVVFLDRIPANVAYEMGFFHGKGRPVLLLTRGQTRKAISDRFSDITGSPLYDLDKAAPAEVVQAYLKRLYAELSRVEPWNIEYLPISRDNLLNREEIAKMHHLRLIDGEYGRALSVPGWERADVQVHMNLLPESRFKLLVRSPSGSSDQTIYFYLRYTTTSGEQKSLFAALSSALSTTYARSNERTVPIPKATGQWQLISGRFHDLLERGMVLDANRVDHLEKICFRGGHVEGVFTDGVLDVKTAINHDEALEVGFIQVIGVRE